MIEAAIDIGTNTMLLLVAETTTETKVMHGGSLPKKIVRVLDSAIEYPRLGEGIHKSRVFSDQAMERARGVFKKYKEKCSTAGASQIRAVGTSASRDAKNAREFYKKIRDEFGIDVQIIPGEKEAELSFIGGLLPYTMPEKTAIVDIGGGSTEFVVWNTENKKAVGESLDIGSVRATEMFLDGDPYSKTSLEKLESGLRTYWKALSPSLQKELREKDWVGIAGTPTTMAAHALGLTAFHSEKVDGYRMDRCMVADLYESFATQTESQRRSNPVVGPGRSDLIVAGSAILLTAMEYFDKGEVIVSSRGLRHGLILS